MEKNASDVDEQVIHVPWCARGARAQAKKVTLLDSGKE